ncbi:MAG: ABC transporter permease [Chloroflexi bacterium]|nr:ABC transporter permease [Chloroflexota bacterium]
MLAYIVRRLLWTPVVLLAVSFFTFVLGYYGPGDPVVVLMGQHNDPAVVERIRRDMGLDRPLYEQYARYVWNVLHGDFGESFRYRGTPVSELLLSKVWVSAQLGTVAMMISVVVGLSLGLLAAFHQGRWADTFTVTVALFLGSLPVFITQPLLVLVLSRWLNLVPSSGWDGLFSLKIIMPALVLSLGSIGVLTRLMRASTLDVIKQDYVRTAHAKGLDNVTVVLDHVTRNAVLPVFTVVGLSLATLVEGAFIAETLFGIPGVGRLAVEAFFQRDYPVITAMVLLTASAYVVANLLVDIGYTFLDPRIRFNSGADPHDLRDTARTGRV